MRTRNKHLIPKQEDPPPQDQKPTSTLTIPRRRKSTRFASLLPTTLHPSKTAAGKTSMSKGKNTNTSVLGVAREHYTRKTDWKRSAFTKLHGQIRCLFCALHPTRSRGTLNRLPDAAARHLRECCAHFEGSEMYARYRKNLKRTSSAEGGGAGRGRPSKMEIVAEVIKEYEKVAVAEVFCRKGKAHKKRCAELGLSPLDVEERLERHAVLYKAEECGGCCPHPSFEECLAKVKEGAKKDKKANIEGKKEKRELKQTVPGQLVHIEEEDREDVLLGFEEIPHTSPSYSDEETEENMLKWKVFKHDEEEEAEVAALLKRRRVGDM